MKKAYEFDECISYCGFDNLPEGLEKYYNAYERPDEDHLIDRDFLEDVFKRFSVTEDKKQLILDGVASIEGDDILFHFSSFLVWDMCSARNRCDTDNYKNMTPSCLPENKELYSFLLLLACVVPSIKMLIERGVLAEYYQNIPYQPMKNQFQKLLDSGDMRVSDFPWDMNFYTCSIFHMDRFYVIPYKFEDAFTMFRNRCTGKVIALRHAGEEFRRDGQVNGINKVYDEKGKFTSIWEEESGIITANPINPMGFVEIDTLSIDQKEWDIALSKGDTLLALHVPSGPGYNPERLKNSMELALAFYHNYFPELKIKGFWSESWLYDPRLSLILDNETSNIVKVQRQFYLYPINEGDDMLRYEAFGDWKAEPEKIEPKTSLQKAAAAYMRTGARFNTMSMIVLKEDVDKVMHMPYITKEDIVKFNKVVDSHLR
jgi:hypothetical protein